MSKFLEVQQFVRNCLDNPQELNRFECVLEGVQQKVEEKFVAEGFIVVVATGCYENWNGWSGDSQWPIPCILGGSPEDAFLATPFGRLWKGAQGEARVSLAKFLAEQPINLRELGSVTLIYLGEIQP